MEIQKRDGSVERQIVTAMIVSDRVLGRLASKWPKGDEDGLLASQWANLVSGWCVNYYLKYGKAPRKNVQRLFASWSDDRPDKDTIKLVEKFVGSLSGEYQQLKKGINPEFVVDMAGNHFNKVRAIKLAEAILGDTDTGKVKSAIKRINTFRHVEVGVGAGINVLQDVVSMKETADDSRDVLFRYPGPLNRFFGDSLERDGFIAFMASEKKGKTFWLLDLAWRAMLHRLKVAFFQLGDLSKRQMLKRFHIRALHRPLKATRPDRPVRYPKEFSFEDDTYVVKHESRKYKTQATWQEIQKACTKVMTNRIKSTKPYLKVSVHPNSSLSVQGMRSILDEWHIQENWEPDVIVADYAELFASPPGFRGETRDAVNENWKAMRRASQELHCLMVTATQANAAAYKADTLGMENFSEDKRKFAHCTGMVGINQTDQEKRDQVQRLNWLVLREDEFFVDREAYAAGCLAVANPAILSHYI